MASPYTPSDLSVFEKQFLLLRQQSAEFGDTQLEDPIWKTTLSHTIRQEAHL
jgi:hypothetical protein